MSYYLTEWGGAANDKSYKYAGSLIITGPFDTQADAWDFCQVINDDVYGTEFHGPKDFAVLQGHIESTSGTEDRDPLGGSGGLCTPQKRLQDEYDLEYYPGGPDDMMPEPLTTIERWWPTYRQDWQAAQEVPTA
jgi:hypothetical protein